MSIELKVSHSKCRCPTCGLFFNSIAGFDKHRVPDEIVEGKRCRSEAEMLEAGMATNTAGYWVTALSEGGFWGSDGKPPADEGDLIGDNEDLDDLI